MAKKFTCSHCNSIYLSKRISCLASRPIHFCSKKCYKEYLNYHHVIHTHCKLCNKPVRRTKSASKTNSNNYFCNSSCAAIYNNAHKTTGTRVSKLEKHLQKVLTQRYPNLEILYNDKSTIKSELDIYIPSIKLAFELNGIFHYEPIYGSEKLKQIQNNDNRKFQACLENGIELVIVDVSSFGYFKIDRAQKYVDIVTNIIDSKLVTPVGSGPTLKNF
jgi:hypothetical protein